jgi:nucleoside-diphosphate-sugar epimerase
MKILVTGATGFVGKAIVAELLQEKFDIYCLGSQKSENRDDLPNFYKADVERFESLRNLENLGKIDVLIHTAGLAHQFGKITEENFWKTNVEGTRNTALLAINLKVRHFILISSVAVYGKGAFKKKNSKTATAENINFIDENSICEPDGIYARSKLESEIAAREICEKQQIPLTILRLATVIGEGDRGNVSRLIKAVDTNRFVWVGTGENYKSLIYKTDVGRACRIVLNKKRAETEIFNLTAEPLKMKQIVGQIASQLKKRIPKFSISAVTLKKLFRLNAWYFRFKKIEKLSETVEKWLSEEVFSGEKIKEEYGFRAETSIVEAIGRQAEFYKNQK